MIISLDTGLFCSRNSGPYSKANLIVIIIINTRDKVLLMCKIRTVMHNFVLAGLQVSVRQFLQVIGCILGRRKCRTVRGAWIRPCNRAYIGKRIIGRAGSRGFAIIVIVAFARIIVIVSGIQISGFHFGGNVKVSGLIIIHVVCFYAAVGRMEYIEFIFLFPDCIQIMVRKRFIRSDL